MIITEKKVITLDNNKKYYIIDDLGNIENDYEKYFFAIGLTEEYEFDTNDIIFIKNYQENGLEMAVKVENNSPTHQFLSNLEAVKVRFENDLKFRKELEEEINKLERESGN